MRLKNIKGSHNMINNSLYVINNPEYYCGHWQELFNNNNPFRIEIGTGKGDFIINQALSNPHLNFIGIEKYDSVLVRAVQKMEHLDLPNLRFIRMDAIDIEKIFNQEIDLIYLNFSDPWPKKRHQDRRLTSMVFLNRYNNIFKNDSHIIMKTDNRLLFEYSSMSLTQYGYYIENITFDLYKSDITDNIPTEYEKRFVEAGKSIYRGEFIKKRQQIDNNTKK